MTKYRPHLSQYPYRTSITTRWSDNDIYGHLNNVVYYQLYDTAVNAYMVEHCNFEPSTAPQIGLVVSSSTDYHQMVEGFPHPIIIGMAVVKLGKSSVEYELGVFQEEDLQKKDPVAKAVGKFVHVFVDRETNRTAKNGMSSEIRHGLNTIYRAKPRV